MATTSSASGGADLAGFLEAAGRSFAEAQGTLGGQTVVAPSAMAIADAELEVKAVFTPQAGGKLSLQPLTMDALRSGIEPGLVSSIRVRYVAIAGEAQPNAVSTTPDGAVPERQPGVVIADVVQRPDLVALEKIVGPLKVEPVFIPEPRRWLVTVRDRTGRIHRELIIPDKPAGGSGA